MSIVGGALDSMDAWQIMVAWTMDWSRFLSFFNIHGEYRGRRLDESSMRKSKMWSCWGRNIRNPTHLLPFFICRLLQDLRSSFKPLNDARDARPSCACYPSTFVIRWKGIRWFSQLHCNINQTGRKEHPDDVELAQDCTIRIVSERANRHF